MNDKFESPFDKLRLLFGLNPPNGMTRGEAQSALDKLNTQVLNEGSIEQAKLAQRLTEQQQLRQLERGLGRGLGMDEDERKVLDTLMQRAEIDRAKAQERAAKLGMQPHQIDAFTRAMQTANQQGQNALLQNAMQSRMQGLGGAIGGAIGGQNPARKPFVQTPRLMQQGSVTQIEELVPIRVATSQKLEGDWNGNELDAARAVPSLFGGKHFILQMGYMQQVGETATFRLVFVANMPVDAKANLEDPEVRADAQRTADAFMVMLNLRRVGPGSTDWFAAYNEEDVHRATELYATLEGKRAPTLLVFDDIQIPKGTK